MFRLDEFVEFVKGAAGEIVESGQECIPMVFAICPADRIAIIPLNQMDKANFKPIMASALRLLNAQSYVMLIEAWVARLPCESTATKRVLNGQISVSDLPPDDKCEALLVNAIENGRTYRLWQAKIRYTPEYARRLDKWEELPQFQRSIGRLILKEW